nr:uncharacterized protein LOC127321164 [Lolium perenne]
MDAASHLASPLPRTPADALDLLFNLVQAIEPGCATSPLDDLLPQSCRRRLLADPGSPRPPPPSSTSPSSSPDSGAPPRPPSLFLPLGSAPSPCADSVPSQDLAACAPPTSSTGRRHSTLGPRRRGTPPASRVVGVPGNIRVARSSLRLAAVTTSLKNASAYPCSQAYATPRRRGRVGHSLVKVSAARIRLGEKRLPPASAILARSPYQFLFPKPDLAAGAPPTSSTWRRHHPLVRADEAHLLPPRAFAGVPGNVRVARSPLRLAAVTTSLKNASGIPLQPSYATSAPAWPRGPFPSASAARSASVVNMLMDSQMDIHIDSSLVAGQYGS